MHAYNNNNRKKSQTSLFNAAQTHIDTIGFAIFKSRLLSTRFRFLFSHPLWMIFGSISKQLRTFCRIRRRIQSSSTPILMAFSFDSPVFAITNAANAHATRSSLHRFGANTSIVCLHRIAHHVNGIRLLDVHLSESTLYV